MIALPTIVVRVDRLAFAQCGLVGIKISLPEHLRSCEELRVVKSLSTHYGGGGQSTFLVVVMPWSTRLFRVTRMFGTGAIAMIDLLHHQRMKCLITVRCLDWTI